MDFAEQIGEFLKIISKGIKGFIDFITNLPTLYYSLIDLIPMPLRNITYTLIGFIIFILFIKVVRLIVG